ncbi:alpha/beta hydrolase [Sphingomonas sp. AX6]|uniref:alpha/beta hydrolase n=1 Tax=Sphingomonas sp. AX6 TaxID=2653171 RepID=UPI0012F26401|nr:alpha/beta hydrolase [Sphingomonas sp. AX6]VXC79062.1 Alpha/beta hydrolase [Sphingomonas sp. AX6]
MTCFDRRTLIGAGASLAALPAAARLAAAQATHERIALWPGAAPGGERVTVTEREIPRSPTGPAADTAFVNVTRPTLTTVRPAKSNGAALLLIPGGGYRRVAVGLGTFAIAEWFAARGFTTHILVYRLPADGWAAGPDAPLQDAQRALRLVRARAKDYDPDRIGVLGFSAGGHLAARLSARQDIASFRAVDATDRLPLAPKVAGLLYPVVSMTGAHVHDGSRDEMFGKGVAPERAAPFAADARIAPGTPPTFMAHAIDDRVVPPENGIAMMTALRAANVPTELHLFERGGHGFGLEAAGAPSPWPELFLGWAKTHGLT